MTIYQCSKCNYKFESQSEKAPKRCPYCSQENAVTREKSADEILGMVGQVEEEGRFRKEHH